MGRNRPRSRVEGREKSHLLKGGRTSPLREGNLLAFGILNNLLSKSSFWGKGALKGKNHLVKERRQQPTPRKERDLGKANALLLERRTKNSGASFLRLDKEVFFRVWPLWKGRNQGADLGVLKSPIQISVLALEKGPLEFKGKFYIQGRVSFLENFFT